MKKILGFLVLAVMFSACRNSKDNSEWIQLFNGENLDGWQMKFTGYPLGENLYNTFRVEDGNLVVSYENYSEFDNEFGHLFTTEEFSHYRLRVEYKFFGEQATGGQGWAYRNNGLMLHAQSGASMALDQDFPTSIETQLLGGVGDDDRTNMNLCTPGCHVYYQNELYTNHCLNSDSKVVNGEHWTTVEVEVLGDSIIKHYVDGEVVLQYTKPHLDPKSSNYLQLVTEKFGGRMVKGHIAIQAESHGTIFRKIEILDLSDQFCD